MTKALVNKILPFSSVDGPGNRTAIFLQGCNFNCLYCHNPETIDHCNHCSPKVVEMTVEDVIKVINKTRTFISGITVSGGECTLQPEFLIGLFKEVKKMGLTVFIDTNGSVPLYGNEKLVEAMDMVMIDVKSYDPEEHKSLTGMDNGIVLENVKYLSGINKLCEVRTVVVPEVLDNYYNIDMISKLITSLDPNIRYKIIKYRPVGVRTKMISSHTPSDEMMNKLGEIANKNGCSNVVLI